MKFICSISRVVISNGESILFQSFVDPFKECSIFAPIFVMMYRDDKTFNTATPKKAYHEAETTTTKVLSETETKQVF